MYRLYLQYLDISAVGGFNYASAYLSYRQVVLRGLMPFGF